jgi:hypothetical protein
MVSDSIYDGVVVMSSGERFQEGAVAVADDDEHVDYTTVAVATNKSVINSWSHPQCAPGTFAYLQPDASIILPCQSDSGGVHIIRLSWNGSTLWDWSFDPKKGSTGLPGESGRSWSQTHDIEVMPNGNILILAQEVYNASELVAMGRDPKKLDETTADVPVIYEIVPTGPTNATFVWRWRWVDRFAQNRTNSGTAARLYVPDISAVPERIDLNINNFTQEFEHPNAIDYNPGE